MTDSPDRGQIAPPVDSRAKSRAMVILSVSGVGLATVLATVAAVGANSNAASPPHNQVPAGPGVTVVTSDTAPVTLLPTATATTTATTTTTTPGTPTTTKRRVIITTTSGPHGPTTITIPAPPPPPPTTHTQPPPPPTTTNPPPTTTTEPPTSTSQPPGH